MNISYFGGLFITLVLIGLPVVVLALTSKVISSSNRINEVSNKGSGEIVSFHLTN